MITDESIKRTVFAWAMRLPQEKALARLKKAGVGDRMARYLIDGKYHHGISLKKAEQILKAMR
jgi:hypothetical protein